MQTVTRIDDQDSALRRDRRPAFLRVAVLCRLPAQGARWGTDAGDALAAALVAECLTHFDYFPVDFTSAHAGDQVAAVFARARASLEDDTAIEPESREQPYDAIVIAGGPDIDSDIGMIHQVLAPCMRKAGLPVLCALGADDAKTVLGDCAWQVFPDPAALLDFIAGSVRPAGLSAEAICAQIRSLAAFLLTERTIEARILHDAAIVPALRRHVDRHVQEFERAGRHAERVVELLQVRLLRDTGRLEQRRARIGVEMARAQERSRRRGAMSMGMLRLGVLAIFVCLTAALWLWTTPATTVFFSGCALVLLSAAYVGIGNRIADQKT